jgi:CHASE3 domain sensor protein
MPTVTIKPGATEDEVVTVLQSALGSGFTVEARESSKEIINIEKSAMSTAHVKLQRTPTDTIAHVHGGGIIIGRIINELVLANKVAKVIRDSPALKPA